MINPQFGLIEEDVEEKIYGVTTGKVINLLDPMALGRVQVQLPFIDSLDLSPWARVAVPMSGHLAGTYFIPNIGDEVLVAFEHGDVNVPYIIGSLWNALAPPPLPSPVPQIRMIRTPLGNQIMFTEVPPTIRISIADQTQSITMSDAGIVLQSGSTLLSVTPAGVFVEGGTVTMAAEGVATLHGATVAVVAEDAASILGTNVCSLFGELVLIN